jgi:prepilin-type N-terminal cleavage/methylation domain-containing protein
MKKKSAFTFIEVIIAITVFAIGVLAVLRLITQNLVTLDTTQARTTATFLAKEGIELIYNMRDSNIDKLLPWDCLLDPVLSANDFGEIDEEKVCLRRFADGTKGDKILQLSFDPESYMHVAVVEADEMFDELRKQNRLYYLS